MSFLENLLTGEKRQDYDDFVHRYDQGEPWDGISDDEAVSRYEEIAGQLSQEDYRSSAQEALGRLSPQQRRQLGNQLRQQTQAQGKAVRDLDEADDDHLEDSGFLAQIMSGLQSQSGGVGQLLGGGGGGLLSSPIAKGALSGIAAMAAKRFMGR
jgi:hypothetical protein